VLRKVITLEEGLGRSTRPEQLFGLLERAGMDVTDKKAPGGDAAPLAAGLRVAEG
jgi:hypothetical protein